MCPGGSGGRLSDILASASVILSSGAVLEVGNGKRGTWAGVNEDWSGEDKGETKGPDEIDRVRECARVCAAAKDPPNGEVGGLFKLTLGGRRADDMPVPSG